MRAHTQTSVHRTAFWLCTHTHTTDSSLAVHLFQCFLHCLFYCCSAFPSHSSNCSNRSSSCCYCLFKRSCLIFSIDFVLYDSHSFLSLDPLSQILTYSDIRQQIYNILVFLNSKRFPHNESQNICSPIQVRNCKFCPHVHVTRVRIQFSYFSTHFCSIAQKPLILVHYSISVCECVKFWLYNVSCSWQLIFSHVISL